MRVGAGIDNDAIAIQPSFVQRIDDGAFTVALHTPHCDSELSRFVRNARIQLLKRLRPVHRGFSLAEQIEIRAVNDKQAHVSATSGRNRSRPRKERRMQDIIVSAAAPDAGIAIVAAITTRLVTEARDRHDFAPTTTAAVGRLITGAALFGGTLKGSERVTLQIVGDGPIGGLSAESWMLADGAVGARAYARDPRADLPLNSRGKFDVAGIVGAGNLQVMKSYDAGNPYSSVVPLHSGEIAEDLAAYLVASEQIPSVVALGVLANPQGVQAAGGIIAQVLPGADEKTIALLEERARAMPPITTLIRDGADAHALLHALAGPLELRAHRSVDIRFACLCTQEKVERVLRGLGVEELRAIATERNEAEVICEYCKHPWIFTREQILALAENIGGTEEPG